MTPCPNWITDKKSAYVPHHVQARERLPHASWFVILLLTTLAVQPSQALDGAERSRNREFPIPDLVESLTVTAPQTQLVVGATTELSVIGKFIGGVEANVSADPRVSYTASPGGVVTVSATGLVSAIGFGKAKVTISFSSGGAQPPPGGAEGFGGVEVSSFIEFTVIVPNDRDRDGMPDDFETQHGFDPDNPADGEIDSDSDGLSNQAEFASGTDPRNPDTDGDGLSDGEEIAQGSDPLFARPPVLSQECIATILNRSVQANQNGTFALGNVPVPQGAFRVRIICERSGKTELAQSPFVLGVPNGETSLGEITFGVDDPIPVTLSITAPASVLTPIAPGAQLVTTGTLADGTQIDLTLNSTGTFYLSSNPGIATISKDGFVTAVSSGNVLVTATHEGVIATIALRVELTKDSDGDGLPDDYEALNALNPGGANLARLPGTQVNASSFSAGSPPTLAIDGNSLTSWFTAPGDAANNRTVPFIEVILPQDVNVAQIRLVGNRQNPDGFDFFAGIFQAFNAAGTEIFNSGVVQLPAPTRDVAVPVDLNGVRRVRFTSTSDEGNSPGLAEIQVISRPGGAGLNPNVNDAAVDFDLDGLTNLQEFNLGTSIFLGDTDGDGLGDAQEGTLGSNPLLADTDNDGLLDGLERNPTLDTDGDGIKNVLDSDSDNDGLPDGVEVRLGLDPLRTDSNGNGIPDGSEDSDSDGLPNLEEILIHTDPANRDTDGDGIPDGEEVIAGADGFITDPLRADTDRDGMPDGYEIEFGLNPTDPSDAGLDPDGDGLTNLQESQLGTDPHNPDKVPPAVSQIVPAAGATDFPLTNVIVIRFNEPLRPKSIVDGVVQLTRGGTNIPGTVALSSDGLSVTFDPTDQLAPLAVHSVQVQGVRDLARNLLPAAFNSSFTTGQFADTDAPRVLRTSPPDASTSVPVNAPVTLEFSERMDPATLTTANFAVLDSVTGQNVAGMIQVDADGRTASFVPGKPFAVGRFHAVAVNSGIKDTGGNSLPFGGFSFTTAFVTDNARPQLLATVPANQDTTVPINALIVLQFDEPLSPITLARGLHISAGAQPVAGSIALSDANRQVTFTPASPLATNTVHTISLTTDITDLAGNTLNIPANINFQTTDTADVTAPQVTGVNPLDGATGVGTNAVVSIQFSERVNPLTVTASAFLVFDNNTGVLVTGTIAVAANGLSATFTPSGPLASSTLYRVQAFSITDLANNTLFFQSGFTTGLGSDTVAPTVVTVSPPNSSTGVPVNAKVVVRLSEAANGASVGNNAVVVSAGGNPVAGTTTLSSDGTILTFTPTNPLAVSTLFNVQVSGFTDRAGNLVTPFASSFTTGASATPDGTAPGVVSVVPASGATGVAVNTSIVLTFDEAIDPTSVSVNSIRISLPSTGFAVAGSYAVNGAVVTFTPTSPLPGNATIQVFVNFFESPRDLAGNTSTSFFSTFETADVTDTTPPQVTLVTPVNGATDIGPNAQVVLTFSESLNPARVNTTTFGLFAGGNPLGAGVSTSADSRTVILSAALPAASVVTVVATRDVQDLSGNALADFSSQFSTAASFDTGRPSVVSQRPGNGATGVAVSSSVVLYVNEPLNAATVPGALFVSQNGVLVTGTTTVTGNGKTIRFVPSQPFVKDALIQVFLTPQALDLDGNALNNYQAQFRTLADTSTTAPVVVRTSPGLFATGIPLNVVIEVEYNEPLNAATVNSTNVVLRQNTSGLPVIASTASLVRGGRVIRIVPNAQLAASTQFRYDITTGLRDLDGTAPTSTVIRFFTTGTAADTLPPMVVSVTPPSGAVNIGINASIRVRFNESINPLTVTEGSIRVSDGSGNAAACTISFSNQERDVLIVPHAPLAANTLHTLRVEGVEDLAGNAVIVQTTQFTTGAEPDTTAPIVVRSNPFSSATDVPVNAVISLEIDEPIDASTVDSNSFMVQDFTTFQAVPGSFSVSADGRVITFVSNAPLAVGRNFVVFFVNQGILDLAGNALTCGPPLFICNFSFTTTFATDTVAPQVAGVSPANGLTQVPTNVRVAVEFDEPVQSLSVDQVRLSVGGSTVTVIRTLSNGNRTLTLVPIVPLNALTQYTLTIAGIKDIAGNSLPAPVTTTFTTGPGADLVSPTVTAVNPLDGATGVGTNAVVTIQFSERVNPLTVTTSTFRVLDNNSFVPVAGTIAVAANGLSATFTPPAPLATWTSYRVQAFSITDLANNALFFLSFFTTGN